MTADLSIELGDDHVGVVEIKRPPNNFFDNVLIAAMADACDELLAGGCRAVVICSEGKHFCAGANLAAGDVNQGEGPDIYDAALRLFGQPLPLVAAVQGAAVGGGLGLALAADFRIVAPEARFSANFALLGIHPGFGISVTLPRLVGRQHAQDLLFTGRRIGGEEALRIGLADRLVPLDDLRGAAHRFAAEIARAAPLAVQSIKATLLGDLVDQLRAAIRHEVSEQFRLSATADCAEGMAAVAERRPARFAGQ